MIYEGIEMPDKSTNKPLAENDVAVDEKRSSRGQPCLRIAEIIAITVAVLLGALTCYLAVSGYLRGDVVFRSDPSSTRKTVVKELVVNINTADAEELKKLDGIGDVLAERIIDYRERYGEFQSASDITKVAGISVAMFNELYPYIIV